MGGHECLEVVSTRLVETKSRKKELRCAKEGLDKSIVGYIE